MSNSFVLVPWKFTGVYCRGLGWTKTFQVYKSKSEILKKIFSEIYKSKIWNLKSEESYLKIQLKPKGFFHNYNRGVNRLLGYKAQHSLYPKKKSGILTAILPEEIDFNFGVFV